MRRQIEDHKRRIEALEERLNLIDRGASQRIWELERHVLRLAGHIEDL